MSYRSKVQFDAEFVAEVVEFSGGEVASIVSKDAVWYAESTCDAFEKLHSCGGHLVRDRYCFDPFGELVDCYQKMRVSSRR